MSENPDDSSSCYYLIELLVKLNEQGDAHIGDFIGISDQATKLWRFAIYIGSNCLLILYTRRQILNESNFKTLSSIKPLTRANLTQATFDSKSIVEMNSAIDDKVDRWSDMEYHHYKKMNLFESSRYGIKPEDFIQTLKFNLCQIEHLEEGDIVAFERSLYHHHAVLTDASRMMVTHRYGEPEDGGAPLVVSASLWGLPTEKALVSEDFLVEVADYRKLKKSNEPYDSKYMPRTKEEIVREAKSRIGERGYSIRINNCQNFASECRNGSSFSPEVEGVLTGAKVTGFVGVTLATCMVILKYLASSRTTNAIKQDKK